MFNFRKADKPKGSPSELKEVLLQPKTDRRILAHVPDPEGIRLNPDRRGTDDSESENLSFHARYSGQRYLTAFRVFVFGISESGLTVNLTGTSIDISQTGILVSFEDRSTVQRLQNLRGISLSFRIPQGAMHEGMESKVDIGAKVVRIDKDGKFCAFQFIEPLYRYVEKSKDRYALFASSMFLLFLALFVLLMRAENFIFFRFNKMLDFYSIIASVFLLSRYFFGAMYKSVRINPDFTPGVTIIIPCFNEEGWIDRTIMSCINQDYPIESLEVIVVDDCSSDASVQKIRETINTLHEESSRYQTSDRVSYVVQEQNQGKRHALARGTYLAKHGLIAFVDSDSFLEPDAIRNLVQPFQDPKMGGVSGRTDVANTFTNGVTKMQGVRYYIAFRIMKAAEAFFDSVTCLSGPLSCYRKDILLKNMDTWLNQQFLGRRATFGDDRAMTNLILREYRTGYQDTAICSTIVPNTHKQFLKQQMRWKRSWLRETIIAATFIWKKEPFTVLFFYMGLIIPIAAPVIFLYNLLYVPITMKVFPTTFLIGIFLMSLMMSFAQLFFRKSSIWLYGLWFVIYYELILLWQMPIAIVTYWKST
ncbi:MAG: glycosyltransferase [Flexilinea sp.]